MDVGQRQRNKDKRTCLMVINSISTPANSTRLLSPLYQDNSLGRVPAGSSFGVRSPSSFQGEFDTMFQELKLENERLLIPAKDRPRTNEFANAEATGQSRSLAESGLRPQVSLGGISVPEEVKFLMSGMLDLLA
jgi:hypothetical protein